MVEDNNLVIVDNIEIQNMIYSVRGKQVMLDSDLAQLYHVETKVFNQAVKRNINRFPEHFRFQLTESEFKNFLGPNVSFSQKKKKTTVRTVVDVICHMLLLNKE
jgi:hypothetical protein